MTHDLIVIGGGPAGIAAALSGDSLGLRTVLVDEQLKAGGQIYRNVGAADARVADLLGPDYTRGRVLVEQLARSSVEVRHDSLVWDVAPDLTVTVLRNGSSERLRAAHLISATGAMERPSPLPGWTLPGVFNAGAIQIAMKSSGAIPAGPIVLAGGGPLLLLVACQLLDAGADIVGLVETSPGGNRLAALPHFPSALLAPEYLTKGLQMMRRLRAAGIHRYSQAMALAVEGTCSAHALRFEVGGRPVRLEANTVLLHHGVVPNTQLSRLLRVDHAWDDQQLAWHPRVDAWGQTSLAGFWIVGDGASIAGAIAAEASGRIAAFGAAHAMQRLSDHERDRLAAPELRDLTRQRRIRPFLDALYRPPTWINTPADDTIVCRCEEVSAGRVREMARLGCEGPNQTKFLSRCGMGPCQGRQCGIVVSQLLAQALSRTPAEIGAYRIRAPLKPVPLSSIANLNTPAGKEPPP